MQHDMDFSALSQALHAEVSSDTDGEEEGHSDSPGSWLVGDNKAHAIHDGGFLRRNIPEPSSAEYLAATRLPAAPFGGPLTVQNTMEQASSLPASRLPRTARGDQLLSADLLRSAHPTSIHAAVGTLASVPEVGLLADADLHQVYATTPAQSLLLDDVEKVPGPELAGSSVSFGVPEVDSCGSSSAHAQMLMLSATDLACNTPVEAGSSSVLPSTNGSVSLAHSPNSPADSSVHPRLTSLQHAEGAESGGQDADEAMLLRSSLTDVVTSLHGVLGSAVQADRSDQQAAGADIELAPPGAQGRNSPAGSTRLASPCSWMPKMDTAECDAGQAKTSTPVRSSPPSLGAFPVPPSMRSRSQKQDKELESSVPALAAGELLPGSPQRCVSPRIGKPLDLPAFSKPDSDSDEDTALLHQLPSRAIRVAQSLLSCKSLPVSPRLSGSPARSDIVQSSSLKRLQSSPCSLSELRAWRFPWQLPRGRVDACSPCCLHQSPSPNVLRSVAPRTMGNVPSGNVQVHGSNIPLGLVGKAQRFGKVSEVAVRALNCACWLASACNLIAQ
jgi:hypothetical protein